MKKIALCFIIIHLCSTTLFCQGKSDWEEINLRGKVKQVMHTEYFAISRYGEVNKGLEKAMSFYTLSFNERGFLDERLSYYDSSRDSLISKIVFSYHQNGTLKEMKSYFGDGTLEGVILFRNDEEKNTKEEQWMDSKKKLVMKFITYYDDRNRQSQRITLAPDGTEAKKTFYKYNKQNKVIEESIFDTELNVIDSKMFYKYNKAGDIMEKKWILPNNRVFKTQYQEYAKPDRQKNWTESIIYDENKKPQTLIERKIIYF